MAAFDRTTEDGETPLLEEDAVVVDFRGRPALRSGSGGWRSARFIIGVGVAERFAYGAVLFNLISYMTGPMGLALALATAAESLNIWSGTSNLLTLFGAFAADSFFGRYHAINIASAIYVLGFGLLTLSVVLNPNSSSSDCQNTKNNPSCSPPQLAVILLNFSLYLIAIGHGGHKPSIQAFGADQFDGKYAEEAKAKSSFFNWWYFGVCFGSLLTTSVVVYIQENLGWGIGFGIPSMAMAVAWLLFLLGTKTYRFSIKREETSPFVRIGRVFVSAIRNRGASPNAVVADEDEGGNGDQILRSGHRNEQFKFLDNAYTPLNASNGANFRCSKNEVEEAKAVLKLIPIWISMVAYTRILVQPSTLYVKQGGTMDRRLFAGINIPAASLNSFLTIAILLFLPLYALLLVRAATAHVFTLVGMQEFFYEEVPKDLKSMGLALYMSIIGVGSVLCSALVSVLDKLTAAGGGGESWFADNLNKAHLDYFYLVLGGLNVSGFCSFLYFARSYPSALLDFVYCFVFIFYLIFFNNNFGSCNFEFDPNTFFFNVYNR